MLNNKHIITAFLVAPLLALISYFSIDYWVTEPAQPAEKERSYRLVEKSNCRYASGKCSLNNGDITLNITVTNNSDSTVHFMIQSQIPLGGVTVALVEPTSYKKVAVTADSNYSVSLMPDSKKALFKNIAGPLSMTPRTSNATEWQAKLPVPKTGQRLRVATAIAGSYYFGEVATTFINTSQLSQ